MADRFAEVREIEGQMAAKIVERDKALWPPRRRRLNGELRELRVLFRAAMKKAAPRSFPPPPPFAPDERLITYLEGESERHRSKRLQRAGFTEAEIAEDRARGRRSGT